ATLKSRGVEFIGPEKGHLACGDDDIGRMSEPEDIVDYVMKKLDSRRDLEGMKVLVTAGPSREMIDPVRFLSNRSSGKMGFSIARAARDRGAEVTLLAGCVSLEKPAGVETIGFTSTSELYEKATKLAPEYDAVIQSAAPADFTVAEYVDHKIKKTGENMVLKLVPTPDIAKALGEKKRPGQVLVAFAAETGDVIENAKGKLLKKNADFVVANDVTQPGAGFAVETNRVTIVDKDGATPYPLMSKSEVANLILDRVAGLLRKD
ncbi:MAG: bifunctional phosphopantothenoylcysteine decarboxylase/phosphopantothenate--cysteine ligase CoaBC, partial [Clostridia bacterium]|nr:bifunctional phosphopantothenoylcysteine decarboxylase/phosphopantothenate--cysteine ligase CoaBC [Clostridia bacterium]